MHFPSQLKSWLGKRRRPRAKKGNRVPFESYYRSLFHPSDRKAHVIAEEKEVEMAVKHAWMLTLDDSITHHDLRRIHRNKPPLLGYVGGLSVSSSAAGPRHTLRDPHYRNMPQSRNEHLIHESLSSEDLPDRPDISDKTRGYISKDLEFVLGLGKGDETAWDIVSTAVFESLSLQIDINSEGLGLKNSQDCTDYKPLVHDVGLFCPHADPSDGGRAGSLSTLEESFHDFYQNLRPFQLDPSSYPRSKDQVLGNVGGVMATPLGDLSLDLVFPEGLGNTERKSLACSSIRADECVGVTPSEKGQPVQYFIQATVQGEGARDVPGAVSALGEKLSEDISGPPFSTPVLAKAGTWEIEILHKSSNLEPALRPELRETEMRYAVLKFDYAFENSDASGADIKFASNAEWRTSKFDNLSGGKSGDDLSSNLFSNLATGGGNTTGRGRSYNNVAARVSQKSEPSGRKFPLKRRRSGDDQNEKRKKGKKDQPPEQPFDSPITQKEVLFPCPFLSGSSCESKVVVKACGTGFPNLSKLKEHIRRAHFPHLQCPQKGCSYCAGSTFEINRHQRKKHTYLPLLEPIEQRLNISHFRKHKALKVRSLTWEVLSLICFSDAYTQDFLKDIGDENEGESSFGDDEIDTLWEGNTFYGSKTDGDIDEGRGNEDRNGNKPTARSEAGGIVGESTANTSDGSITSDRLNEGMMTGGNARRLGLTDVCDTLSAAGSDLQASGEHRSFQTPGNISIRTSLQGQTSDTPHKHPVSQSDWYMIYDNFEKIRWRLTPQLIAHLEAHCFHDESAKHDEINRVFEELSRAIDNHSWTSNCDAFKGGDEQLKIYSGHNSVPVVPSSSTVQSFDNIGPGPWYPNKGPFDLHNCIVGPPGLTNSLTDPSLDGNSTSLDTPHHFSQDQNLSPYPFILGPAYRLQDPTASPGPSLFEPIFSQKEIFHPSSKCPPSPSEFTDELLATLDVSVLNGFEESLTQNSHVYYEGKPHQLSYVGNLTRKSG